MTSGRGRTGVCVVRVLAQSHGTLITLRINPDIDRFSTGAESSTADVESAVQTMREFLQSFLAETPES
ncbi:hypothetical protein ACFVYR_25800 [Streptomyces sp. NPDC058284]|uniref:hypothetical protein n=1 Tax=unclassified Streptomyces TaxID=2593676 RepID=UPI003652AEC6